jgi:threonine aldolase
MPTLIDLRSDTLTRPTPGMREAMARAEVGDDVFGEDPTVRRLEERVADLLGHEAAVFVPSGTMGNQIAVRTHTRPGDELFCDVNCHIYNYEAGGPAVLSGVMCRTLEGEHGILDVKQLEGLVRPDDEHHVRSRLVCLENTHNRGGGRLYPIEKVEAIRAWTRQHGLALHLDGARLWNAIVATGIPGQRWGQLFDSVSVCFSKGLGAPVGSALVGPRDFIKEARRSRKLLGGGMRQAGVLAAAALYALDHHIDRLADDHANARLLAEAIADSPGLGIRGPGVDTNLIWFTIDPETGTARDFARALKEHGVVVMSGGPHLMRACTHLDVSADQAKQAATAIRDVARSGRLRPSASSPPAPAS